MEVAIVDDNTGVGGERTRRHPERHRGNLHRPLQPRQRPRPYLAKTEHRIGAAEKTCGHPIVGFPGVLGSCRLSLKRCRAQAAIGYNQWQRDMEPAGWPLGLLRSTAI